MEMMYLTYSEAQQLVPFFQVASRDESHGREAQESARRILQELSFVKDRDYSPMKGKQIILSRDVDLQFLLDAMSALQVR